MLATLLLALPIATSATAPAARYVVRHVVVPTPRVEFELHVAGDADGDSSFSVPDDWGGVDAIVDHLHDLAFHDPAGQPLAFERIEANDFRVTHAAEAALTATWWIGEPQPPSKSTGNDYRPCVTAEAFRFLGSIGLLRADALADGERHRFVVDFEGCDAPGRGAACSFGRGPHVEVEETLDAFCHSIFIGGAVRLHERDLAGKKLLMALTGTLRFTDDDFVDLATQIIRDERAFFADSGDDLFVLTLALDPSNANRNSLGGTGLTRSFALCMTPAFTLAPGSDDRFRIAGLLAHEHFHHWNGEIVRGTETEGLGYWFSEGFTDFFTRRLMVRSGTWSIAHWQGEWNHCLQAFLSNPARNAPAARITQEFWSDRNVSDLPYQRGAIVAALLDREIRASSDGARSLDDFMRDVVAAARGGANADTAALLERVADETSAEFAEQLRAIVVDGALPPLEEGDVEDLFGPLIRVRWKAVPGQDHARYPRLDVVPATAEADLRATL